MLEIKGHRIVMDGVDVGIYKHHKTPSVSINHVLSMFSPECRAAIRSVATGTKVIDYIWLSDIAVGPSWRRQGIASKVIRMVAKPGTLIACAPGSGVENGMRMNHQQRLEFYKALDFTIVEGVRHDYAFLFTKRR